MISIVIPQQITTIPSFAECSSLFRVNILSNNYTISRQFFLNCISLESIDLSNCKEIDESAFHNCISLKKIIFPLVDIRLSSNWMFRHTGIEELVLPDNILEIGMSFCYDCNLLKHVTIGQRIEKIGDTAFLSCPSMVNIIILSPIPPQLGNNAFGNTNNCPIYVPIASLDLYRSATNWGTYANRIIGQ